MRLLFTCLLLSTLSSSVLCQQTLEQDPNKAQFIRTDIRNFWTAFDEFNSNGGNPFSQYLEKGSQGLKDFIPYRIENPRNLKKTVKKRKSDYERIREKSNTVENSFDQIRNYYTNFKELYDSAAFPTT